MIEMEQGIFRLDRNLSNNIMYLHQAFGEDTYIISSLLCFIAWKHKHQLFNVGVLDPTEFGRMCKFQPGYLRRRHPAPAQLERLSIQEKERLYRKQEEYPDNFAYRVYDSILENALYMLYTRAIAYPGNHVMYRECGSEIQKVEIEKITFFKHLRIVFHRSKGKCKIFYEYELDESFVHNLNQYYLVCNLSSFVKLRKKRLDTLYLFIKNLREYFRLQNKCSDFVNFNLLCELARINRKDKRMRKQDLKHAFEVLGTLATFQVKLSFLPLSPEQPFYISIIDFPDLQAWSEEQVISEKQDILFLNFVRLICVLFKKKHDYFSYMYEELIEIVLEFVRSNDRNVIQKIYIDSQILTFKKLSPKSSIKFEDFYAKLIRVKTLEDLKSLFVIKPVITYRFLQQKYEFVGEVSEEYKRKLGWLTDLRNYAKNNNYTMFTIGDNIYLCK